MGVGVSFASNLPSAVAERVGLTGGVNGVQHDGNAAACRIFHPNGNVQAAGRQTVLLVLHGTGAHGHVRQQVVQIAMVFRVEHLVRAAESVIQKRAEVELPDGDHALNQIRVSGGVWEVEHSHISFAEGARLIGIDAGDEEQPVCYFLL